MTRRHLSIIAAAAVALASLGGHRPAGGQGHAGHGQPAGAPSGPAPVRATMEALHASGGVPPGWRFTLPAGDVAAGRQAFIDLKCYTCHAMQGEQFPLKPGESATAGPDLTGMAAHHPSAYLVESILNPSAVLVEGPGYIGGDNRSIMPSYPDLTAAQLIDLLAYLGSRGSEAPRDHEMAREQSAGGYRVRLEYRAAGGGHEGHQEHQHGMAPAAAGKGRLLAFVTDAASGQAVPYLPVSARIESAGQAPVTVSLAPAMGAQGFHYGADAALPERTTRVIVTIGAAKMRLAAGAPAQLGRPQTVSFDWR
jgi:hypothetical protein